MKKYVYFFGGQKADGDRSMKSLLGGKGANLAEMVNIGIPVPPGFTITTEVCQLYQNTKSLPQEIAKEVLLNIKQVEKIMNLRFGDAEKPLLFSVRSGAAASMPGMMDTVLNLGLTQKIIYAWIKRSPELRRFVFDSYRRFITMYSDIVMQTGREEYEDILGEMKKRRGIKFDSDLTAEDLEALSKEYLQLYSRLTKSVFPEDPYQQLFAAINAVFRSWGNPRATIYRRLNNITGLLGTAVNVQAMVFGNINDRSATGVAFSRSPSSGKNFFYGEYLVNAQGEDVVAGIRTPQQIGKELSLTWAQENGISEKERVERYPSMEEFMPENYKFLCSIREKLENHYRDMQDIEFTVQDGRLWMLQCRNAKRTAQAAVRCAIDMVNEGRISKEEAVLRIDPSQVDHLMHPQVDPEAAKVIKPIGKGLAASPGAATGQIVFNADDAKAWHNNGKSVIMVRLETSPEDLGGMNAAVGVLTVRGGMTSHAAVVARGMGKTCVCGAGDINIQGKSFSLHGKTYKEGDIITLDGTRGLIYEGAMKLLKPSLEGNFKTILSWCQKAKRLGVRANADTPKDAQIAVAFGAEGVGLCRTEHMFFDPDRIGVMREMILATTTEGRKCALDKMLPMQRQDFLGIFEALKYRSVTIRLLDPPLHEFVPHDEAAQRLLAKQLGISFSEISQRVKRLAEENPMLGHRGCRLGITYPEIYNMQVQAIMEAAVEMHRRGISVKPEIMIPLIGKREELHLVRENVVQTADKVIKKAGITVSYMVGTMIEVPRAAITADKVAQEADFFSFGTNDLTQMGCGFSRDDSASFLRAYIEQGIYQQDPFQSLDQDGVGELIRIAVQKGRAVKPLLKMGICGEHGGDPTTISFCHKVGLNYVSCSPFRVPTAIVAAAHADILEKRAASQAKQHPISQPSSKL